MPHFVSDDGVRLHYRDEGKGQPILFLHGWTMSSRFFYKQFDALASRRRLVALDLRGCGGSERRKGATGLGRLARDVRELLDALDLRHVTMVGWSLGGGITMRYVDEYGTDRLRSVCLIDFPPRLEESPDVADKVCHHLFKRRESFMTDFIQRMFQRDPEPGELAWMLEENRKCDSETACETYREMRVPALSEGPRSYDTPCLLVFPESGWFPRAIEEWKRLFPNHESRHFPHSCHCPFLEEPGRFNETLLRFTEP